MLLVPLATGAIVVARSGVNAGALALFVIATLALFWLRTPVEAWLGLSPIKAQTKEERGAVLRLIVLLCAVSLASLGLLVATGYTRGLVLIGSIAALAFVAQEMVKKLGRSGRMPAQIVGAIGLTSTAAGAYYVASGRLGVTAIMLWMANWLFAVNQIHFVQVRIRGSKLITPSEKMTRGKWFLVAQIALIAVLALSVAYRALPLLTLLAFLPALWRGLAWFLRPTQPLDVHKLGLSELKLAIVFGALLSAAFLL